MRSAINEETKANKLRIWWRHAAEDWAVVADGVAELLVVVDDGEASAATVVILTFIPCSQWPDVPQAK